VRKLYLVPIIHMSADMGSLGPDLDERAVTGLGQELWQKHKGIVSKFWDSVARFFDSLDVTGFKLYQDGLVANGEDGLKIVTQGIKEGSRNYQIIWRLLQRGAILVRTEDISLVGKEYDFITKMARAKSLCQRETAALRYRLAQGGLLQQRDIFIAKRINETLKEGEAGILFIGAYHDVLSKLPDDVQVSLVKNVTKVRKYHKALADPKKHNKDFDQLGEYLTSPVTILPP